MTKKQQPTTLDSFKREAIEKIYQGKPLTQGYRILNSTPKGVSIIPCQISI